MVVVDAMEKTAACVCLQTELNDSPGVCLKFYGPLAISRRPCRQPRKLPAAWAPR